MKMKDNKKSFEMKDNKKSFEMKFLIFWWNIYALIDSFIEEITCPYHLQ